MDPVRITKYQYTQKERLNRLKASRANLYRENSHDVLVVNKDLTQDDIFEFYTKRIEKLEKCLKNLDYKSFQLKGENNEVLTYVVTNGEPQPQFKVISKLSPIGMQLCGSNLGDKVIIKNKTYTITLIS